MMKIIFLHLALFGSLMVASAQTANNFQQASNYILSRQGVFNQTTMQSGDLYITSSHVSSISGVEHIYLQQTVGGIDVLNGVGSVHLDRSGKVAYGTSEFYNVDQFTIQRSKNLDHKNAIRISAAFLQIEDQGDINMLLDEGSVFEKQVFSNTSISTRDIVTKLVYVPIGQNLVLSIEVFIDNPEDGIMWLLYVNSQTGEMAKTIKLTAECDFGDRSTFQPKKLIVENSLKGSQLNGELNEDYFVSNSYLVYPIPLEAPNEGPQSIVVAPWTLNSAASPYGWHDTNGMSGAEYTITRGNNVYASEDQDNNDIAGFSPDGGANLEFNFPVDTSMLPTTYISGSVTNLFYMNNIMHDVIYNYGFDEVAGNFQANNYGKGGVDNDYVLADALDGSGTDNANFSTPPDGSRPRMQMYRWTTGLIRLTINAPAQVAGTYTVSGADFNPMAATVTGDVVLSDPSNGCTPFSNAAAVNGKIAMIDRGDCAFVAKVDSAIAAGATGVIICNHTAGAGVITMGGMGTKSIPAVMLSYEDCQLLKPLIGSGLNATITIKPLTERDSDLDNGIIAHEYGHGISTRLTGGAGNSGCLNVDEQMGEGWSDFWALLFQLKTGDQGTDKNGIGTYSLGQSADGDGIRPFPYSTDFMINPVTYNDIAGFSIPHGVGSVWCSMLWDMTWNLIEKHGFEENIYATTGGNGIAMQLVMEGMKLQPCNPGFVNGRDAILKADTMLFSGANGCEIWSAFARRGLGVEASQGSSSFVNDGVESYQVPPSCPTSCTDEVLTYSNTNIPGGTNRKIYTTIAIDNSVIQAGNSVSLSAGQGISVSTNFEVEGTAEVLLDNSPCDPTLIPSAKMPNQEKQARMRQDKIKGSAVRSE